MRLFVSIIMCSMLTSAFAQENLNVESAYQDDKIFTYNYAKFDLLQQANEEDSLNVEVQLEQKSVLKAALFSAVIPGAGQFYTKNYWRAALYAGLEVAFWGAYASYTKKGDDVDSQMRSYADNNWAENKYWSYVYQTGVIYAQENPDTDIAREIARLDLSHSYLPAVDIKEGQILVLDPGYDRDELEFLVEANRYTHNLPRTHTQQYYEMIYKYLHQFGVGWDDVYEFHGDPFYYDRSYAELTNTTPSIDYYRDLRNESNDHYATATTMVNLVLLNHLVSTVDAIFAAKGYNRALDYKLNVGAKRSGDQLVNTLGVTLKF